MMVSIKQCGQFRHQRHHCCCRHLVGLLHNFLWHNSPADTARKSQQRCPSGKIDGEIDIPTMCCTLTMQSEQRRHRCCCGHRLCVPFHSFVQSCHLLQVSPISVQLSRCCNDPPASYKVASPPAAILLLLPTPPASPTTTL